MTKIIQNHTINIECESIEDSITIKLLLDHTGVIDIISSRPGGERILTLHKDTLLINKDIVKKIEYTI